MLNFSVFCFEIATVLLFSINYFSLWKWLVAYDSRMYSHCFRKCVIRSPTWPLLQSCSSLNWYCLLCLYGHNLLDYPYQCFLVLHELESSYLLPAGVVNSFLVSLLYFRVFFLWGFHFYFPFCMRIYKSKGRSIMLMSPLIESV